MAQISTAEIVATYGVSTKTVYRMRDAGELGSWYKVPGKTGALIFDSGEVAAAFQRRTARTAA